MRLPFHTGTDGPRRHCRTAHTLRRHSRYRRRTPRRSSDRPDQSPDNRHPQHSSHMSHRHRAGRDCGNWWHHRRIGHRRGRPGRGRRRGRLADRGRLCSCPNHLPGPDRSGSRRRPAHRHTIHNRPSSGSRSSLGRTCRRRSWPWARDRMCCVSFSCSCRRGCRSACDDGAASCAACVARRPLPRRSGAPQARQGKEAWSASPARRAGGDARSTRARADRNVRRPRVLHLRAHAMPAMRRTIWHRDRVSHALEMIIS
jgi:hypothetical protein